MTGPLTRPLPPYVRGALTSVAVTALVVLGAGCSGEEPAVQTPPADVPTDAAQPAPEPESGDTGDPGAAGDPGTAGATDPEGPSATLPDQEQGALLGQFVNFALRPSSDAVTTVDFADQVDLGLGNEVRRTLPPSDLGSPRRWMLPTEQAFGRSGFLSSLELITNQAQRAVDAQQETGIFSVLAGERPRCSEPASEPLEGYTVEQQISVLPGAGTIDSCEDWFAVDLYVDDAGQVAAVRVDLFDS